MFKENNILVSKSIIFEYNPTIYKVFAYYHQKYWFVKFLHLFDVKLNLQYMENHLQPSHAHYQLSVPNEIADQPLDDSK
jgi:hypothetical protein